MGSVLVLDIGGAGGIRAARMKDGSVTSRSGATVSPEASRAQVVTAWHEVVADLGASDDDDGDVAFGVAFPGFLDASGLVEPGIYVLAMAGMDLRRELQPILPDRPVVVLPDLAAAALAEARAPGRSRRVLCVGLGTGTNAAFVSDGRVVDVAAGCLGDAGHVIVEEGGPLCRCGGRGCLEAICSGYALAEAGRGLGFADAGAIVEAARSGDGAALQLLGRAGRALGRAIASWAVMTFPDEVVVVGGLAGAGEWLLGPAMGELRQTGQPARVGALSIYPGIYGPDAVLNGAALAAADVAAAGPSDADAASA